MPVRRERESKEMKERFQVYQQENDKTIFTRRHFTRRSNNNEEDRLSFGHNLEMRSQLNKLMSKVKEQAEIIEGL